jgi:hypothetical protein
MYPYWLPSDVQRQQANVPVGAEQPAAWLVSRNRNELQPLRLPPPLCPYGRVGSTPTKSRHVSCKINSTKSGTSQPVFRYLCAISFRSRNVSQLY